METNNMAITNKYLENYLQRSRVILESIKEDLEIMGKVSPYGYTDEKLDEGLALYNEAFSLYQQLLTRRGEQYRLRVMVAEKFDQVFAWFSPMLGVLRIALRGDKKLVKELGLEPMRSRSITTLINRGTQFFNTALSKTHIQNALTPLGFPPERLQADLDALTELHELHKQHINARGDCQRLVKDRNEAYDRLKWFMLPLKKVLRMVYKHGNMQTLERAGIFVRNQPKTTTGTGDTVTTTDLGTDPGTDPGTVEPLPIAS